MNEFINILDKIVLSNTTKKSFYHEYQSNEKFKKWINIELPFIKVCMEQEQINPWHIYNVFDHILVSIENINKFSLNLSKKEKRMLAYIMLLHDAGKPLSNIRLNKDGVIRDIFPNHQIESVNIAKQILPKLNFKQHELQIMYCLIENHDLFMYITLDKNPKSPYKTLTISSINDIINNLNKTGDGLKLFTYLILIAKSDNLAQNIELTKDPLKVIDKANDIFKEL